MNEEMLKHIIEAALLVASEPLPVERLQDLFATELHDAPDRGAVRAALETLQKDYEGRGVQLVEVASGYRFQTRTDLAPWVSRLWGERPQKYSRALLETLAIIAYRQPITRGEIEDIRGVAVSQNIIKTLTEREWIRVAGHRDVPGRPAVYATTRQFLDYFNLKSLSDLPSLAELRDIDDINLDLFGNPMGEPGAASMAPEDADGASAHSTDFAQKEGRADDAGGAGPANDASGAAPLAVEEGVVPLCADVGPAPVDLEDGTEATEARGGFDAAAVQPPAAHVEDIMEDIDERPLPRAAAE